MEFEFYWADYKRSGSDGSLITLGHVMEKKLTAEYGSDITRIFICGHCRALIPPNENLSKVYDQFKKKQKKTKTPND